MSGTINGDRMNHDPAFRLSAMKAVGRVSQRYLFLRTLRQPSHLIGQKILGIASRSRILSSLIGRRYQPGHDAGSAGTATIYNVPLAAWKHWIRPDSHADRPIDTIGETATSNLAKDSVRLTRPIPERTNSTSILRRSMYPTAIRRPVASKLDRKAQSGRLERSMGSPNPSKPHPIEDASSKEDKGQASPRSIEKQPFLPSVFSAVINLMRVVNRKQSTPERIARRDELSSQTTNDAAARDDSRIIRAGEVAAYPAEPTTPLVTDLLRVQSKLKETQIHTATPLVSVKRIFSPINVAQPPIIAQMLNRYGSQDPVHRSVHARGPVADASKAISISKYVHQTPESQPLYRTLTLRHGVSAGEHPIDSLSFTTPYSSDIARSTADRMVTSKHLTPLPASLQRSVQKASRALGELPLAVPASAGGSSRFRTLTRTVSPQPRQDIPSPVESAPPEVADKTNAESVEDREQRNVEIAEFVIRKLSTMLEVERDRRGYSRWH